MVLCTAAVSVLALREFLTVLPREWVPRPVAVAVYLTIPFQYLWIWLDREPLFLWFIPVAAR